MIKTLFVKLALTLSILVRFLFILEIVAEMAFILYVRIMAKKNNDRRPITIQNPVSGLLQSQLEQQGGANDMVKNIASSLLTSQSTVMEYDIKQANNLQGGVIFTMAFMWFLHFKMEQVQPLLIQIVAGFMKLVYHPLFQSYVLGRNLERPFKTPVAAAQNMFNATKVDESTEASSELSSEYIDKPVKGSEVSLENDADVDDDDDDYDGEADDEDIATEEDSHDIKEEDERDEDEEDADEEEQEAEGEDQEADKAEENEDD